MSNKLLVSPYYMAPMEGPTAERFGRSFYREDLGFGKIESPTGPALGIFGRIHLYDLQGLETVVLEASFNDSPIRLLDDSKAPRVIEESLEFSLRAFPGAPPSIYQK